MPSSIELRQERAKLVSEARKIIETAETENKRSMTNEEQEQCDRYFAAADDLKAQIDTIEKRDKLTQLEADLAQPQERRAVTPRPTQQPRNEARYSDALRAWMLGDRRAKTPDQIDAAAECGIDLYSQLLEMRTGLLKGTSNVGGYTVPVGFHNALNIALKLFCPLRNFATVISTGSGNDLHWPTVDDTSNVAVQYGEAADETADSKPTFSEIVLKAWKYNAFLRVSEELLTDSAVDIESLLGSLLGTRVGRQQSADFTTGGGTTLPTGVVTAASSGVDVMSTTIDYDNLISLVHSVEAAYRPQSSFMMHDSVVAVLRKLKDDNNVPLWQTSLTANTPDKLLGYSIITNNAMADASAENHKCIIFGDFSQYIVRDVGSLLIARSDDRYFEYGQVAFKATLRSDGNFVGPSSALKYLTT